MEKGYVIGMDLGTTNVKAILIDEAGVVKARASRENHLLFPGADAVEQDAEEWWKNAVSVFQDLTREAGSERVKKLKGLCISSQTVTMLPVDGQGKPLRNALIWMDKRSSKEMHEISRIVGHDRFAGITGAQPDAGFLPNKLLWFKTREPELFEKTDCFLQASSFLNFRLTGEKTTDLDQAVRTQCLDINTKRWSKEIGDAVGMDFDRFLPRLFSPSDIIGRVTEQAARETGLLAGIPVLAGGSDAIMSLYATGISKLGEAAESSGTSSLVFAGCDHGTDVTKPVVAKPCEIPGLPFLFDAPISTSGAALKWFLDELGEPERAYALAHGINVYDRLNEMAEKVSPGANGVLFFPYLLGERAPLWNSHSRGMFIGMSLDTKREDLLRAVFEGTSFALRHVVETIREAGGSITELRIAGGGAKSRTWAKIKASMLHVPVLLLSEKAGDIPFGDALMAGKAVELFSDPKAVMAGLFSGEDRIDPVPEWEAVYDRLYPYYLDFYRDLDKDLARYKDDLAKIQREA